MKERPILFSATTGKPSQKGKRLQSVDGLTWKERNRDAVNKRRRALYGWFAWLWSEINGAESWDANPFVWVIDFRRLTDAMA